MVLDVYLSKMKETVERPRSFPHLHAADTDEDVYNELFDGEGRRTGRSAPAERRTPRRRPVVTVYGTAAAGVVFRDLGRTMWSVTSRASTTGVVGGRPTSGAIPGSSATTRSTSRLDLDERSFVKLSSRATPTTPPRWPTWRTTRSSRSSRPANTPMWWGASTNNPALDGRRCVGGGAVVVVVRGSFIGGGTNSARDKRCRWLKPDHSIDRLGASQVVVKDQGMVLA